MIKHLSLTIRQRSQWSKLNISQHSVNQLVALYDKYSKDLECVRAAQTEFYIEGKKSELRPQLCDIEAELTYLRIREFKPINIVEFSPGTGWSTSWILSALRDNGIGMLYSYDLCDTSKKMINHDLAEGRWELVIGDVREYISNFPENVEYFFIDSAHTAEFAKWYIGNIFNSYPEGTKISVHDIVKYHYQPGCGPESMVLCDWLVEHNLPCFTASKAIKKIGYNAFVRKKKELGISELIHHADYNSMIFFQL